MWSYFPDMHLIIFHIAELYFEMASTCMTFRLYEYNVYEKCQLCDIEMTLLLSSSYQL